jgi:tetratricopeptide (TPR) repeat protein
LPGRLRCACWLWLIVVATGCSGRGPFSFWRGSKSDSGYIGNNGDLQRYQHPAAEQADKKWSLMPWAREVNQANNSAARQSQAIVGGDPLSLRNTPKNLGPDIFVRAAQLYEAQGNLEKSAEYYQKALDLSNENEQALMGFARLYDRQGDFEKAVGYYQRALRAHPQSASLRNDMGICFARWGRVAESLEALQQAIQLQPNEALYRNNIAKVLVQGGYPDQALPHLLAVFPPAAAHYNLGYLLYEQGRHDMAAVHFQQALQIDPAFGRAARMISVVQNRPGGGNVAAGPGGPAAAAPGAVHSGPQLQHPGNFGPQGPLAGGQPSLPRVPAVPQSRYANEVPGAAPAAPQVYVPR